jgi:glutamyl-tRNA synthetase
MIAAFDIRNVNKAASAFNGEKLLWLNQQHMMRAAPAVLAAALREQLARIGLASDDAALLEGVALAQRERSKTLKEMAAVSRYFFEQPGAPDAKSAKLLSAESTPLLRQVREGLAALGEWRAEAVHGLLAGIAERAGLGLGKIAQPLRVALTGGTVSPPIDATVALLGRERSLARLDAVLDRVQGVA